MLSIYKEINEKRMIKIYIEMVMWVVENSKKIFVVKCVFWGN